METNLIDYDFRLRGSNIEADPQLAIEKLDNIAAWMKSLTEQELNQSISLSTEVSTSTKEVQIVQTSLAREIIFVSSHAVHHYAMIAQITFAQTTTANTSFGVAPATATYLREKNITQNHSNK
jgi:hypothetical protein